MICKNDRNVVNKMKISFFMIVFFLTVSISNVKPNINYATTDELVKTVKGVGRVKSLNIVNERKNGLFKNKEDFYTRVVENDEYSIGDVTYKRIIQKYDIGE